MLAFSYTFYIKQGGKADLSNVNTALEYTGKGVLKSTGGGSASFSKRHSNGTIDYSFDNYAPEMLAPSGKYVSFIKMNIQKSEASLWYILGTVSYRLYKLGSDSNPVKIQTASVFETAVPDYSSVVTITCNDDYNASLKLSIKRGDKTTELITTTDRTTLRKWVPFQFYNDKKDHFYIKDKNYGWWPQ